MIKRYWILGLVFLIALAIPTGGHHDIRWVPERWCGHGPPYSGTLWVGSTYGIPFNWVEIGRYEKCTTVTSIIPDIAVYPAGLLANIWVFATLGFLFKLYEEFRILEVSK